MRQTRRENYCKFVEKTFNCRVKSKLMGKDYIFDKKYSTGKISRTIIEDGLEAFLMNVNSDEFEFDFSKENIDDYDFLEVGYCYEGKILMESFPQMKKYTINKGDLFIYKTKEDIKKFNFKYDDFKSLSITMDFALIKTSSNPEFENELFLQWQNYMEKIFKDKFLIVENASLKLSNIAYEIQNIKVLDMIELMKLKVKVIEFLTCIFEEKVRYKIPNYLKNDSIFINAKGKIEKNFRTPPTILQLCDELNVTPYKLQKLFKENLGITIYEYIKQCRLQKAKYLLENTSMNILEVVNEVGYENPSKFATLFRKYYSINPLEYKKNFEKNF